MLEKCRISGFADEINQSFAVQLAVLKELGQSYIELRSADGTGVADFTLEQAKALKKIMTQQGICVSAIGSPIGKIKVTDAFEPHFKQFRHVVELAKLFDTPYIRMFSFYVPHGEENAYRGEVLRRVEKLVDYATKERVTLLHENEKGIYGADAPHCLELMQQFYGESFACTFDFANFVQVGQDTKMAYEMLEPYIRYIHIKDAKCLDGEVVLPGDGDGNVQEILGDLDKKGFDGFLSLEPHLCSFEGLEKLEAQVRQKKETDGIAAYQSAYQRLQEMLADAL